jgi:hypothetical protein
MAVIVEEAEQQSEDSASQQTAAASLLGRLPPMRIVLVPFAPGEVELLPLDE